MKLIAVNFVCAIDANGDETLKVISADDEIKKNEYRQTIVNKKIGRLSLCSHQYVAYKDHGINSSTIETEKN